MDTSTLDGSKVWIVASLPCFSNYDKSQLWYVTTSNTSNHGQQDITLAQPPNYFCKKVSVCCPVNLGSLKVQC